MAKGTLTGDTTIVLPELDDPPADPLPVVGRWIADAERRGVREPRAAVLATTDGVTVSSRTLLVKDVSSAGAVFGSSTASRKGRDLAVVPHAALTFYWRETLQQVHLAGQVELLTEAESDALFDAREPLARVATAVSAQSEPLDDEPSLRAAARTLAAADGVLARPGAWRGHRLVPDRVELWHGSPDRLHRRLEYTRSPDGWAWRRLQP